MKCVFSILSLNLHNVSFCVAFFLYVYVCFVCNICSCTMSEYLNDVVLCHLKILKKVPLQYVEGNKFFEDCVIQSFEISIVPKWPHLHIHRDIGSKFHSVCMCLFLLFLLPFWIQTDEGRREGEERVSKKSVGPLMGGRRTRRSGPLNF